MRRALIRALGTSSADYKNRYGGRLAMGELERLGAVPVAERVVEDGK